MAVSTVKKTDFGWKFIGSATGKTQSVTVPTDIDAKEIKAVVLTQGARMESTLPYDDFYSSGGTFSWGLFGYYITASDYGLVNLTVNNGSSVVIRNCIYGHTDSSATAILSIYYR